eukprot:m.263169 g.263169  ORF g.263169 m.263169 type:complete len:467 (+) comp26822_c0_seq1:96-1496(+)
MRAECLIGLLLVFTFAIVGVHANFFVILLEGSQILTGLGEFTFLHTFTDIPVNEGTLGVHEIELVVKTSPGLSNGGGVAQHGHSTLHLGQVTAGDNGGGLVVDTDLETGGAPVDKLDGALGLDGGNGSVDVLGDDITTVQHAAGHVLAMTRIALDHLVGGLKAGVGDFGNRELLVVGLLGRDDGGVGGQGEMDTWVGHQVSLELSQIDVEGTIETEGGSHGGHNLGNQAVQVGVGGALNVQVAAANVVDGLVVNHKGTVGVLEGGVAGQDGVVGLDNSGGHLRGGVDGKLELGLLAIVNRQALHEERSETGSCATTEGVEDEETLETGALVSELADSVKDQVNNLLANGVVATGVVVGGILLAGDELLGVEQLAVGASTDLVDDGGLQVNKDGTGDVLASTSLGEKGVEGVIAIANGLVRGHLTVRLDTVLEAVKLPAGITDLATGLSKMNRNALTHVVEVEVLVC